MSECQIPGCTRPYKAKGFCLRHYQDKWREGREWRSPIPRLPTSPLVRVVEARLAEPHLRYDRRRPGLPDRFVLSKLRRSNSISIYKADEHATAMGMHPSEIWPEWWDVPIPEEVA